MEGGATAPRGRPPRNACDLCRHRKIRCDREKPNCETCQLAGVQCTFTPGLLGGKKTLKTQLAEAKARLRLLESSAAGQNPPLARHSLHEEAEREPPPSRVYSSFSPNLPNPEDFDVSLAAFYRHLEVCGLGTAHSAQRASLQYAVQHQTGAQFNFEEFCAQVTQSYSLQYPLRKPQVICVEWPEDDIIRTSISYYATEGLYSIFPVLEIYTLNDLFKQYLANRSGGVTQTSLKTCLCAFTAFIVKIHGHHPAFVNTKPDAYVHAALTLLPNLLLERHDMRTLESLVLLVLYITPSGQSQSGRMLLALAVQVLCHLGGTRVRPQDPNSHHLRALFWLCYGIDKEMSIRETLPPLIRDSDCDLDLPRAYVLKSSDRQFLQMPLSSDVLLFPSDLRLAMMKSKVYERLYSDHARTQPEARRLEHVRQLDLELDELKSGFPVGFRPNAYASKQAPEYKLHDFSLRGANLHLEYYFCLKKIHEAGVQCSLAVSHHGPLSSSVELYYESSRSTLLYYIRAQGYVDAFNFWIHADFVFSAIVSLFRYLIENPAMPTFASDVYILEQTREIFARVRNDNRGRRCFPPIFMAEAFIVLLTDLAKQGSHVANKLKNQDQPMYLP